ncbi:MAG TPA: dual specificity protein phosphatase family protein [Blastocatellia bacterium]|nr:dual specificity protein phosphatase family protein [Blastocatellia bacterium]
MRVYYRINFGGSQKSAAFALLTMFVFAGAANAGTKRGGGDSPAIKIDNFGQMDERFYRGAQPHEADYGGLAALGIKTIIDLTDNPTSYEKPNAEAAGIRYVSIPMSDSRKPASDQIDQFMKLVNDPATGKFFVHCIGGRHRTGVMGAVYRMNQYGWSFDQAYNEMKQYDFYTRFGHGALKDFVKEYAGSIHKNVNAVSTPTVTETSDSIQTAPSKTP